MKWIPWKPAAVHSFFKCFVSVENKSVTLELTLESVRVIVFQSVKPIPLLSKFPPGEHRHYSQR